MLIKNKARKIFAPPPPLPPYFHFIRGSFSASIPFFLGFARQMSGSNRPKSAASVFFLSLFLTPIRFKMPSSLPSRGLGKFYRRRIRRCVLYPYGICCCLLPLPRRDDAKKLGLAPKHTPCLFNFISCCVEPCFL